MQNVTYNPYADNRHVDFRFSFGIFPPDAPEIAVPRASEQIEQSRLEQTHDNIRFATAKHGSLEHNFFLLDGSFVIYPDDISNLQVGAVLEDISNRDGVFENDPWIEFSFSHPESSYAFTMYFDELFPLDYPTDVTTIAYDASGNVMDSLTTHPNGAKHIVPLTVSNYSKVRFEFGSTSLPYRRVRIIDIAFGIIYDYQSDTVASASLRYETSPIAETLPSAEVAVTIDNSDHVYNLINPTGLFEFLEHGQFMDCHLVVDGAIVTMGRHYFTSSSSKDGGLTAELVFNDRFLWLDDPLYQKGRSGTWTLAECVASILEAANVNILCAYNGDLESYTIGKGIPPDTTCREALRLACQAAMCTCYIGRDDILHFVRPEIFDLPSADVTRDEMHDDAQVGVEQSYNTVELIVTDTYADADNTYTASAVDTGDYARIYSVSNPLVTDSKAVAEWLLGWLKRRLTYDFTYRGNPALEILDAIRVHDVYGVNDVSLLTTQTFFYDGGLSADGRSVR